MNCVCRVYVTIIKSSISYYIFFLINVGALVFFTLTIFNSTSCNGTDVYQTSIFLLLIFHFALMVLSIIRACVQSENRNVQPSDTCRFATLITILTFTYLIVILWFVQNLRIFLNLNDQCDSGIINNVKINIYIFFGIHVLPCFLEVMIGLFGIIIGSWKEQTVVIVNNDFTKSIKYSSRSFPDNNSCCVCLENYIEKHTITQIKECGHIFHTHCIGRWLERNQTCPICRGVVGLVAVVVEN
jgi:hypothetical protein